MSLSMDTVSPFCSTSAIDRTSDSDKAFGLFVSKNEMSHWFLSLSLFFFFSPCRPILWALWPRNNLQSWLFVGQSKTVPLAWCVLDTCAYLWVLIISKSGIFGGTIVVFLNFLVFLYKREKKQDTRIKRIIYFRIPCAYITLPSVLEMKNLWHISIQPQENINKICSSNCIAISKGLWFGLRLKKAVILTLQHS